MFLLRNFNRNIIVVKLQKSPSHLFCQMLNNLFKCSGMMHLFPIEDYTLQCEFGGFPLSFNDF